jgi:WD40 repeat protein
MDLLGDIGAVDQLTATREENKVLKKRVEELSSRVKVLTVENEALKAEVEMYRGFSNLSLEKPEAAAESIMQVDSDDFVKSGDGIYPCRVEATLTLHGSSNPICCSLSKDDTIVASGGADSTLVLSLWNSNVTHRIQCEAPVICTRFSPALNNVLAFGCMDGSLSLVHFETFAGITSTATKLPAHLQHRKYVRSMAWSPTKPLLATSSADGNIQIHKVNRKFDLSYELEQVKTLHLSGSVEALCFVGDQLVCYARGTPHLSCYDLEADSAMTKVSLNQTQNGGFEDHVSFCVMDLRPYDSKYLAAATDANRNVVLDFNTGRIIRNLYGHSNDSYSTPKISWSRNGQYIFGNTQDSGCVCVWDVASSNIVDKLEGHANPVRDLYVGNSDTLVTTSFDKKTKIWVPNSAMASELGLD